MDKGGLRAVIFGATGAVGKTLVPQLLNSDKWSQVVCVVRKKPEQWEKLVAKQKLNCQIQPDMDKLLKPEQWKFEGFDVMFVCFGSQVKHGEQTFRKVDKTYPLMAAEIAIRNKIPHYMLVSSSGADPSSMFLYMRVKGEVERDLKLKKQLNMLSILKPGLIKNRPDARTAQKIGTFLSFIPFTAIQCLDLSTSMMGIAQKYADQAPKSQSFQKDYSNRDLLDFVREYKKVNKIN